MLDPYINKPNEIQEYLEDLLSSQSFRHMVHAGAEIPNYILPFPTKESEAYSQMALNIQKRLGQKGIVVKIINLYDEMLYLIGDDLDAYLETEDLSKKEMFEDFSNILDLNNKLSSYCRHHR